MSTDQAEPTGHPLLDAALQAVGLSGSAPPASALPRDRRKADPQAVSDSQRWRLLQAFAHVVATKGLAATTIEDVTGAAGVSKKTFYKFFASKEEAFLACYEAVDRLIEVIATAPRPAGSLPETIRGISGLYLAALAAAPDLTHLLLVEALAAGPRVRAVRAQHFDRFVALVQGALAAARTTEPELPAPSDAEVLALVGGINELCVHHLTTGRAATLPDLEPTVTAFVNRHLGGDA
jgi:AcrR family transcriptional regulator